MQTFQPLYTTDPVKPELSLDGACSYRIEDNNRVIIEIATIANSRNDNAISGSLSIELWALKQPYQGDHFDGIALAGTQIGELYDQYELNQCRYDLCFQEPSAGSWHLCLMLREWDGASYVTRDFVNFDHAYAVNWKPVVLQGGLNPVTNNQQEPEAAVMPGVDNVVETQEPASPVVTAAVETSNAKSAKKPAAKAKAEPTAVNLNTASLKDITALKGVSKKVAEAIVADRPFKSMNALLKVKGVGEKLLEKLKDSITL